MNNDWKPTPQTPEEVADGLRDAMKQAKEDGVFDWGATIQQPKFNTDKELVRAQKVFQTYGSEKF